MKQNQTNIKQNKKQEIKKQTPGFSSRDKMTRSSQMLSNNLHLVDHDIKDKQRDQNKSFVKIFFFKFTGTPMLLNS